MQFSLAVDRGYKDQSGNKQTDFINCVAWKGTAENLAKYQSKGSLVLVEGSIQIRSYDKNGVKHYITEVVANRIEFLSPKKEENSYQQPQNTFNQYNQHQQSQENQSFFRQQENPFESKSSEFVGITNDDLPF